MRGKRNQFAENLLTSAALIVTIFILFPIKHYMLQHLPTFYIFISCFSFIMFFIDKQLSKNQLSFRIPESMLLIYTMLGGWIGSIVAIHKTKKFSFLCGMGFCTLVNIYIVWKFIY